MNLIRKLRYYQNMCWKLSQMDDDVLRIINDKNLYKDLKKFAREIKRAKRKERIKNIMSKIKNIIMRNIIKSL